MRSKYGAVRSGGFGSKLEHAVHELLKLRERAGEISDIKCQQTIVLQDGPREVKISWRVDFSFLEDGALAFAEAKGFPTESYSLKLKLFRGTRKEKLYIYKGTHLRPTLAEIVNE